MKLWIDDVRVPPNETWVWAKNFEQAVRVVAIRGLPDEISFDHDLGLADERTGLDIAHWLVDADLDGTVNIPPDWNFHVHSANPVGARNIRETLAGYLRFKYHEADD